MDRIPDYRRLFAQRRVRRRAFGATGRFANDATRLSLSRGFHRRDEKLQFIVSAVRRSWGEKNKDALVRYVRSLASAFRYMRDPANRDEVVRIVIDTTGSSEAIARSTLALYFDPDRGVVPKQGEIDIKGFAKVIQVMAEAGELAPPVPPGGAFHRSAIFDSSGAAIAVSVEQV